MLRAVLKSVQVAIVTLVAGGCIVGPEAFLPSDPPIPEAALAVRDGVLVAYVPNCDHGGPISAEVYDANEKSEHAPFWSADHFRGYGADGVIYLSPQSWNSPAGSYMQSLLNVDLIVSIETAHRLFESVAPAGRKLIDLPAGDVLVDEKNVDLAEFLARDC